MPQKIVFAIIMFLLLARAFPAERPDRIALSRIMNYAVKAASSDTVHTYSYLKYNIAVPRRNFIMYAIPGLLPIAKNKKREFMGEAVYRVALHESKIVSSEQVARASTIKHLKNGIPALVRYSVPSIYSPTLAGENILSPIWPDNRKYYHYTADILMNGQISINFKPRTDNTQLVHGKLWADYATGRIDSMYISGEYDMVRFSSRVIMSAGNSALYPTLVSAKSSFKFLGNHIDASYTATFGLKNTDSLADEQLIEAIRPVPLTETEQQLYAQVPKADTTHQSKKSSKNDRLWQNASDYLLDRIKANLGANQQGYVRISPLLNPLYMGYTPRKGFIYQTNIRMVYPFSGNSEITARFKSGYAFGEHQFYYKLPVRFDINKRHGLYVAAELGNNNPTTNSAVMRQIEKNNDFYNIETDKFARFSDNYATAYSGIDVISKLSLEIGMVAHHREALKKNKLLQLQQLQTHRSSAPYCEINWRPSGWDGPVMSLSYERGIKGLFKATYGYSKWETKAEYKIQQSRLQTVWMAVGAGCYTYKSRGSYFLYYSNFKDTDLPGGWDDELNGSFVLLPTNYYNYSDYYIRANASYESPLLILSSLPFTGKFIETERIYLSTIYAEKLQPYVEVGYAFRTRLFSMGAFCATLKGKFYSFGCKWGFELFRHW